jgi:RNA polymerase sigma factor (sigma-70 family)
MADGKHCFFWSGFDGGGDILLKMSDTDLQLLARFTRQHAEDAFAELVRRHLDLVFSAALRQVRSPQLAEEVAQSAFTDLARQAHRLAPDTILTAWLYQVTRRTAIDVVRREARRQLREQIACELNAMNTPAADWTHMEPLLDEAMHALEETDRTAVLLRYFENKSLREVGQTLGTNEDAARKRVSRAVERLREFFAKRGVTVAESGLGIAISANAVQAAPAGLAATISAAAALAGTGILTTATAAVAKTIVMTTLQKSLITATLVVIAGAGVYEARQAARLRDQVQTLQQQQAPLAEQIQQLQRERDEASNKVALLAGENERLNRNTGELPKLRAKASAAQAQAREIARLKSTVGKQPAPLADFLTAIMTNNFARGRSAALKGQQQDALAQIARMKTALSLTEDQERAINDIMTKHIQHGSQVTLDMLTGKLTPEQLLAETRENGSEQVEIKALLTPEQLAAYPAYQQAEKTLATDNQAKSDASRIANDFNLSKEQQEQIRSQFHELYLRDTTSGQSEAAIKAQVARGNLTEAAQMETTLRESQLEEKQKILGSVLSLEQLATYRQEQLAQIKQGAEMSKMFLSGKPAGTTN